MKEWDAQYVRLVDLSVLSGKIGSNPLERGTRLTFAKAWIRAVVEAP